MRCSGTAALHQNSLDFPLGLLVRGRSHPRPILSDPQPTQEWLQARQWLQRFFFFGGAPNSSAGMGIAVVGQVVRRRHQLNRNCFRIYSIKTPNARDFMRSSPENDGATFISVVQVFLKKNLTNNGHFLKNSTRTRFKNYDAGRTRTMNESSVQEPQVLPFSGRCQFQIQEPTLKGDCSKSPSGRDVPTPKLSQIQERWYWNKQNYERICFY